MKVSLSIEDKVAPNQVSRFFFEAVHFCYTYLKSVGLLSVFLLVALLFGHSR